MAKKRRPTPGPSDRIYSDENLAAIAASVGRSVDEMSPRLAQGLETAAHLYIGARRLERNRTPHHVTRRELKKIEGAARRLLKYLGAGASEDAPNEPFPHLLLYLASGQQADRDVVTHDVEQIGRLADVVAGLHSAEDLASRAADGIGDTRKIAELTSRPGHSGDGPSIAWTASIMGLYERVTGQCAGTSVSAEGKPGGPLIRFLKTAGKPIGIRMPNNEAWRARIRYLIDNSPRKKRI